MPTPRKSKQNTINFAHSRTKPRTYLYAAFLLTLATLAPHAPGFEPASREVPDARLTPAVEAFAAQNYAEAEARLRALLDDHPESFILHYNLACALSMQGDTDRALEHLMLAARFGFTDGPIMRRDPHLAAVRDTEGFRALDARWDDLLRAHADAEYQRLQQQFGPTYHYHRDDDRRLLYAVAYDRDIFEQARAEIDRTHAWFARAVEPTVEHAEPGDAWISIILPSRPDFERWARQRFGPAGAGDFFDIGGEYHHDRKQLVAADLGPTLRHEYAHVLHWRHNTRLAQRHPVWIQEGLCSLPEDLEPDPQTALDRAVPNWRTNSTKRLASALALPPVRDFVRIPRDRFTSHRPLANYAIARTIMLFLEDRGQLRDFYRIYTETIEDDPTGYRALIEVSGLSAHEFDRAFRLWLRDLPEVPERVARGSASLGVEVEAGTGLGPVVVSILRPRAERRDFPLRTGDTITAINARPVRDLAELIRVLADYQPGDTVEITLRRGNQTETTRVQLVPRS